MHDIMIVTHSSQLQRPTALVSNYTVYGSSDEEDGEGRRRSTLMQRLQWTYWCTTLNSVNRRLRMTYSRCLIKRRVRVAEQKQTFFTALTDW